MAPRILIFAMTLLPWAPTWAAKPKIDQYIATQSLTNDLNQWSLEALRNKNLSEIEKDAIRDWVSLLRSRLERRGASVSREDIVPAVREIMLAEGTPQRKPHSNLLPFAQNMTRVYQDVREKTEDAFELMKTYAAFGSIQNPASVDAFAKSREYANAKESKPAAAFDPEVVGLFVEPDESMSAKTNTQEEVKKTDEEILVELMQEGRGLGLPEDEEGPALTF